MKKMRERERERENHRSPSHLKKKKKKKTHLPSSSALVQIFSISFWAKEAKYAASLRCSASLAAETEDEAAIIIFSLFD